MNGKAATVYMALVAIITIGAGLAGPSAASLEAAGSTASSPIDERYHFTFSKWSDEVVRLRVITEPGSDLVARYHTSVTRPGPELGTGDGPLVHFTASRYNGTLTSYDLLQWSMSDDPQLHLTVGSTEFESAPIFTGSELDASLESFLASHYWRGGEYVKYFSTQGGNGNLWLNITGTTGYIGHEVEVLSGAKFLRAKDFEGVAAQGNVWATAGGTSLLQTAVVSAAGPAMGFFYQTLAASGSCTAPDGQDCRDQVVESDVAGDWTFNLDAEVRIDGPMWYVGSVVPR